MKKKLLEEYFIFSKKERNAVLLLVLLVLVIFVIPYYFPATRNDIDAELIAAVDSAGSLSDDVETGTDFKKQGGYYNNEERFPSRGKRHNTRLFYFDPNNLSADGWISLGVKERTVQTIAKYLAKGGSFRAPEDIKRIYGIPSALAEQLVPFVRIKPPEQKQDAKFFKGYAEKKSFEKKLINLNDADSISLIALKGIGPKLAGRIIKFRDRLGGFHSKDQLREVYGLQDSTLQLILPQLDLSGVEIKRININEADVATLGQHPYIGRNFAKVIVSYRDQHGGFSSADDLLKIDIVTPEFVSRLSHYLRF
jgi:DNA uptake protein ComE-like DNA-binding protein